VNTSQKIEVRDKNMAIEEITISYIAPNSFTYSRSSHLGMGTTRNKETKKRKKSAEITDRLGGYLWWGYDVRFSFIKLLDHKRKKIATGGIPTEKKRKKELLEMKR